MYKMITIANARAGSARHRHPWIFRGALTNTPSTLEHGELIHVEDENGVVLGTGTYSTTSSIAARLFDSEKTTIDAAWLVKRLQTAHARKVLCGYGLDTDTTGYRVVFGEADGIPGLVVDRYGDVFVIQISTAGMDKLRPLVVDALKQCFSPQAIVERSDIAVRAEERLEQTVAVLQGVINDAVPFTEHGYAFFADVLHGQKTGFYLDQKNTRRAVARHANDKNALFLFSYSGSAAIYALKNGAQTATCIDSSTDALALAQKHAKKHRVSKKLTTQEADIFDVLKADDTPRFDMVVLDPPALIKNQHDMEQGKKAYHFLNRGALRLIKNNGIFITSSCSHFLSHDDFVFLLRRASVQSGVVLHTLEELQQSADHPTSLYFPESRYLKTFVFLVERHD